MSVHHIRGCVITLLVFAAWVFGTSCTTTGSAQNLERVDYPETINRTIGLYNDPQLESTIRRLGYRLANYTDLRPESFSFYLMDQEMPNAFAALDGSIFLSRGLLALANNEDALAGILAHEMIHLVERHHERQVRREKLPEMLLLPGQTIGKLFGRKVEQWINTPVEGFGTLYLNSHSRAQEFEADWKGAQLAAAAGYDPLEMAKLLTQMEQTNQLLFNRKDSFGFFNSHPPTAERVERILEQAHTLDIKWENRKSVFPEGSDFLQLFTGLCFGPNPDYGLFIGNQFLHPQQNYFLEIPEKWAIQKGPNLVGAIEPKREAAFFLGTIDFGYDPMMPAIQMKDAFYEEYRILPIEESSRILDKGAAYSLVYRDHSGDHTVFLYFSWIEIEGRILQFVGSGPEPYYETLNAISKSIRPLSPEEIESIYMLELRVTEAEAGETLYALSKRTNNEWSPAFTAIANGIPQETTFAGGERVKVVCREPYAIPPQVPPQNR